MRRWIGFEHGVNLGGWLSQCDYSKDRLEHFIVEEDIKRISDWPVDHVRLPIDYNVLQDQDGTFIESGFEYVRKAIHWCRKYGLNIILDLHKTAGYSFDQGEKEAGFFDNSKYQEMFYSLWEEMAKRYAKYGDHVAFELLNEVTDKNTMESDFTGMYSSDSPDCSNDEDIGRRLLEQLCFGSTLTGCTGR